MGIILEMACASIRNINILPQGKELCVVVLHYSATKNYKPEFAASALPNDNETDLQTLIQQYKSAATRVNRVILLAPAPMLSVRVKEFPGIECHPLVFSPTELQSTHWQILMGALGEADTPYLQVMNQIIATYRDEATIEKIRTDVEASYLSAEDKDRARIRLQLAESYIKNDAAPIASYVKPGNLVLVDLRDEYIKRKDALALFYVINQLIADAKDQNNKIFHKMCVRDEFHKLAMDSTSPVVESVIESIREMRHKSCSVLIASQDPLSVPLEAIEMRSLCFMLRMSSPRWLDHVGQVKTPYREISAFDRYDVAQTGRMLRVGEDSKRSNLYDEGESHAAQAARRQAWKRYPRHGEVDFSCASTTLFQSSSQPLVGHLKLVRIAMLHLVLPLHPQRSSLAGLHYLRLACMRGGTSIARLTDLLSLAARP